MEKYAVIVAGGSGSRIGGDLPKQFLLLKGKPVLWFTLTAFLDSYKDMRIILVLPEKFLDTGRELVKLTRDPNRIKIVAGGSTRFHSVQNGLAQVQRHSVVFVHDGVRCLVSSSLIRRCYKAALDKGNAIPATRAIDSIRIETLGGNKITDRNKVRIIQTPQTFFSDIIKTAFDTEYHESFTDEASVVEKTGVKIHLVEGEETNIKITKPVDLLIAEKILEERLIL
jgi:2-C-methyl-D-erythritol 4-phosphate cytidylyltransferase